MDQHNSYRGFKDLNCWKEGRELRNQVAKLARMFPPAERHDLQSQLVRASRSVTANIAEGYGRFTYTDTKRFFIQARGSVTEIIDHLSTALDEGYIAESAVADVERKCETVFKLINGYIAYLDKAQKAKTNSPANSNSQ